MDSNMLNTMHNATKQKQVLTVKRSGTGKYDTKAMLNPALAKNGVVIFPNILEVEKVEKTSKSGTVMVFTTVKVEYTFYCAEDGSSIKTIFYGEGSDTGDKSINKAMSAAMKYACFQVFCIPTENLNDDADGHTPEEIKTPKPAKTPQVENTDAYITTAQRNLLFANTEKEIIKNVISEFGYESTKTILKSDFDKILKKLTDKKLADKMGEKEADTDNDLQYGDNRLPWEQDDIPA